MTMSPASGLSVFAKRALTAAVGIPLFVWIVLGGPRWLLAVLMVALSAIAAWELMRMFERAARPAYVGLGVAGAAVVTASFAVPGITALVFTLAIAITLSAPLWDGAPPTVEPVAAAVLAIVYVGWLLGHGLLLGALPMGPQLLLFLVGTTWSGESAAYVVGSAVGRHALAPVISPRKTLEGALGQLVVSLGAGALLGTWLVPQWSMATSILAGAVLGVTGQIGDLVESVIKRGLGTKDAGDLIPGHGGALDRLDGLLFNAPALFYYANWVGGR